jgi:polysaccharide export outer membrane protein
LNVLNRIALAPICALAALVALAGLAPRPALAQDGYGIQPGDTLSIEVIEDPGLNRTVLVGPDGRITLPLAGAVQAGGRTVEEVMTDLQDRLAPNFAAPPNVFVGLASIAEEELPPTVEEEDPTIDVYVVGEAASPGLLTVAPGTTVLQIFAQMGGFSPFAATRRIQLRRIDPVSGQETVYALDYEAIERGASRAGVAELADGDVIVVPQRRLFE